MRTREHSKRWTSRLLPVIVFVGLLGSGCGSVEDKVQDAVGRVSNDAAAKAIETAVADELDKAGIKLDGSPSCSPDLSVEGAGLAGTVDCQASTEGGKQATAEFDGSISTSGCDGSLVVQVEGRKVVDITDLTGCSLGSG